MILLSATYVICQALPAIVNLTLCLLCCLYHLYAWIELTNLIFQPNVVGTIFLGHERGTSFNFVFFWLYSFNWGATFVQFTNTHNFRQFFQLYTGVKFFLF